MAQGVELQESEGDLRIKSCFIQDGDRMNDTGPGCTIYTRTQI